MIEKLTKEQEKRIPEFVDKWLRVGLNTERLDWEECKKSSDYYYEKILGKETVPIVLLDSPLSAWMGVCMLGIDMNQVWNQVGNQVWNQVGNQVWNQVWNQVKNQVWNQVENQVRNQVENQVRNQVWNQVRNQVGNQVRNQVGNQVENQVWNQVGNQVWNQVGNQVENQVWNQVGNQVRNQVGNQVRNQVGNQVENQVWNQVENQVGNQVRNFIYPYIDGNYMSAYFSFYDFMNMVLGIEYNKHWEWLKNTSKHSLMYPLENACVFSQKPILIRFNGNKQLHCDDGASVEFADGFNLYSLNGVNVSKNIVETKAEELDCKTVLTEKNAEVRREIIRKIGINRIIKELDAKVVEKSEDGVYELLNFDIIDGRYRPYLKMLNPSIGTWHVEGVHPDCKTIEGALAWRNGEEKYEKPEVLT